MAIQPEPAGANDTVLCPRCSGGFECGIRNVEGCWCTSVTLDDQVRDEFARFYEGCLCPDCLQTIEDARPPKRSVWEFLKKNFRRRRSA